MRPSQARFVTSCQQLLALAVVLAVLTPAASVVSLDVVQTPAPSHPREAPGAPGSGGHDEVGKPVGPGNDAKPGRSLVPTDSVAAEVTEVDLTPQAGARPQPETAREPAGRDRVPRTARPATTVVGDPEPVEGYATVGITWSHASQVEDDGIRLQVRTSSGGRWSGWTDLEYHDEHAPDPTSTEAQWSRPGTEPLLVGDVDQVQARAVASEGLPPDMSLAVITPGQPAATASQAPGLSGEQADTQPGAEPQGEASIQLRSTSSTAPRPTIYTRAQWGADERMRDGSPSYGTISAGFVHHTVNGNDYTRDQVPGILRSIYAYHTRSRGWSDIGYNFLVDKFGRIWEGRYGGVARPVIGAHTLGYNEDSFAMSAIGNFDTVRPPDAMLRAYGALFAWKLGLHGIDPLDKSQNVNGTTFPAVNGHRDAGSTACPGRYLYEKLPAIRQYAAAAGQPAAPPQPVVARQVDSDLAAGPYPDIVVRRGSDGRGMILPTGGLSWFRKPAVVARSGWAARRFLLTPDVTGDDRPDLVTFDSSGTLEIRPGRASGGFARVSRTSTRFRGHSLVTPAGDLDGDRRVDFVARSGGHLVAFHQNRRGSFRPVAQQADLSGHRQLVGAGDVTGDGRPDLWARHRRGGLYLHRGLGGGRFAGRTAVPGDWSGYDWFVGGVDYTGDTVPDLLARRTNGALMLLPARSDGTVGRALGPVSGRSRLSMVSGVGQLAGDAQPDLVAARSDGALVVLGYRGTFHLGSPIDTGHSFALGDLLLNAGDFTGDGHGDVIVRRRIGSLWLYGGDGSGRLAAPVGIGGEAFRDVAGLRVIADVTGDSLPDLIGRAADGQTMLWPGNGAGPLGTPAAVAIAAEPAVPTGYDWTLRVSDLQRRGNADLVVRDRAGLLYRLDGRSDGYAAPRYLGEAGSYDLGG